MGKFRIILIGSIILFLGVIVYFSPDEAYWTEENVEEAIETGRRYVLALLKSDRKSLLSTSLEPARSKIQDYDVSPSQTSIEELWNLRFKKKISPDIIAPLFDEVKLDLLMLENLDNFIVMTFAWKNQEKIVEIPNKGKALFAVAVKYYKPIDNRLIPKLIRKIANLYLIRNFSGHLGTTGHWVVFDFKYNYNFDDYYQWVLSHGEEYTRSELQREGELRNKYGENIELLMKNVDEILDLLWEWGSRKVEYQINYIEKIYNTLEEIENSY